MDPTGYNVALLELVPLTGRSGRLGPCAGRQKPCDAWVLRRAKKKSCAVPRGTTTSGGGWFSNTSLKTTMEPQTGGLEDDFPFSKGWFSGSMLVFGVVFLYPYPYIGKWSSLRSIFFQMGWDHQLDNICPPGAVVVFFFALISKAVFY